MTAAEARLPGTRSVLGLLHVPQGDGRAVAEAAGARLQRHVAPLLPDAQLGVRWDEASRSALVVVGPGSSATPSGAWGAVEAAGPWVRWATDTRTTTVTTSSAAVATLRRADGPHVTAWATRSLAALVLAGRPAVVRRDVVPELVLLDGVLGDDDLLGGVSRLPPATVLELSADGHRARRWADDAEDCRPGPPTTAELLRQAVLDAAEQAAAVPDAALGLTAGRDSGLLAAALAVTGNPLPTFTLGWAGLPDVDGAVSRAQALRLPHRTLALEDLRGDELASGRAVERALRRRWPAAELLAAVSTRTRWSDGHEVPRNALLGGVVPQGPPVVWLSGSGGELARALYWHDAPADRSALDVMTVPRAAGLDARAARDLTGRVAAELDLAARWGRPGRSALDVLYLRSRMRNWFGNLAPLPAFTATVPGLLQPELVRVLLDVPEEDRRTGRLFDQVTAALLHEAAGRPLAAVVAPSLAPPPLRRWPRRPPLSDWPLLSRLLRHLDRSGPGLARDVMGEGWWQPALAHAPSRPYVRQWLWNAVAVDVLALVADGLEVPRVGLR